MQPRTKLALLVLGAAGVWALGMLGLFLLFLSRLSDVGNNTGALAAPLVAVFFGFIYGVFGAFLVAVLLGISVAALNELGLFAPWSRLRVRVWALTTSLVALGGIAVGYRRFPGIRSIINAFFELFR
jgi:hypothetical protein